jgi:hypothetical protein
VHFDTEIILNGIMYRYGNFIIEYFWETSLAI